ncbi:Uncharacterized protein dnm_082010 [Desulfonema magnum]|uniref:Uncharacterized protein n=1 Tax=Desulfonema magnum TaxID=45655 RepID=A0A975GSJ3_9BACT|nr:Uncharacterized protein dnm_082010 [Desulfonema magnum]
MGQQNRNKYLTISFQYLPGEETRLFYRNEPPPVTEKAGFLRSSQKKMYKKLLIGYLFP